MLFVNLTENLFIERLTINQLNKKIEELYNLIKKSFSIEKKDVFFILDEVKNKESKVNLSSFNIVHSHNFQHLLSLFIKTGLKDFKIITYDVKDIFFVDYWDVYLYEKDSFTKLSQEYCFSKFQIEPKYIIDYLFLKMNSPFSLGEKKIIDLLEKIWWLENLKVDKISNRRTRALLKINAKRIEFFVNVKNQILNNLKK